MRKLGLKTIGGLALGAGLMAGAGPAAALGTEDYIASIGLVASTYCPVNTMEAAGQLLPISGYEALFSLVGTTYGGDGRTNFMLPDLRDKVPLDGMHYCIVVNGLYPSRP